MKPAWKRNAWLVLLALAGGTLLVYAALTKKNEAAGAPLRSSLPTETSSAAPEFSLPLLDGGQASLSQFRGKVVILDFWASWCPPCKREIPDFVDLQQRYGAKGLQVVGVALDDSGPVRAFAASAGINYPVLLGDDAIARLYGGIEGIPTTFVIDRQGRIVKRYEGYRPRQVFEEDLAALL